MNKVVQKLLKFRDKRNWKKFHTPQNIAQSIVLEATEILEIFQWKPANANLTKKEKEDLAEEMADVYNWLMLLAHDLDINLEKTALKKIKQNERKYPVGRVRGSSAKYSRL